MIYTIRVHLPNQFVKVVYGGDYQKVRDEAMKVEGALFYEVEQWYSERNMKSSMYSQIG